MKNKNINLLKINNPKYVFKFLIMKCLSILIILFVLLISSILVYAQPPTPPSTPELDPDGNLLNDEEPETPQITQPNPSSGGGGFVVPNPDSNLKNESNVSKEIKEVIEEENETNEQFIDLVEVPSKQAAPKTENLSDLKREEKNPLVFFISLGLTILILSTIIIKKFQKSKKQALKNQTQGERVIQEEFINEQELQLKKYIDIMRSKNYSDEQIKNELQRAGWGDELLNKFF